MADEIRISDLLEPVYTQTQQSILAYGESLEVDLSRDSILEEAMQITGLFDLGPRDFTERLELLVAQWSEDSGISNIGRLSLRNKLVQHATSRLLIEDCFNRHPEIHQIKIERPIIVIGLPRSGTTHLLNLMAADTRLRSLPLWESYEPVPRPGEGLLADGSDPRYRRCAEAWEMMQQVTPHLAAMHPMAPDHIHEELELMGPDFASYNCEWLSPCPRWRDHYYASDQTPHYEYMKKVLKLLLWQQQGSDPPRRWVLKCPQHLEQMPVLQKVFPDATFAITHRDPVAVIQSTVTMLAYGKRSAFAFESKFADIFRYYAEQGYTDYPAQDQPVADIPVDQHYCFSLGGVDIELIANRRNDVYEYLAADWQTGEVKAVWEFPDDSVLWNNWGGITVFLEDGDLLLGGFFAIKRYDIGGLR